MPLILPGNVGSATAATGYNVANSCRFNSGDSAVLKRTHGTPTNGKKFVWSAWIKRSKLGADQYFVQNFTDSSNISMAYFRSGDDIRIFDRHGTGDGTDTVWISDAKFRDVSAWMHFLLKVDTTQGTDSNRLQVYINGSLATGNTITYPAENAVMNWTAASASNRHSIAATSDGYNYVGGYLCEVVLIDGTAPAHTDFGEVDSDSGIWKPIDVSGLTFGNNGYYLDFADSGDLGDDESGNGNDFAETNLAATDQSIDTCTNNFATFNSLYRNSNSAINYAEGNLSAIPAADGSISFSGSTIAMPKTSTSKWYAEFKTPVAEYGSLGIMDVDSISQAINDNTDISSNSNGTSLGRVLFQQGNGVVYYIGGTANTGLSTENNNDIISIAWDAGAGKFYVAQNGTYGTISGTQQDPANGTAGVDVSGEAWYTASSAFVWYVGDNTTGASSQFFGNFGSPHFAISSGNTDANGYGNFEYAVPSGFYALCTKNLAEFGG